MCLFLSISMFPPSLPTEEVTCCNSTKTCHLIKLAGEIGKRKRRGPEEKAKMRRVWKHSRRTALWLHVNWSDLKKNPIFLEGWKRQERAEGKKGRGMYRCKTAALHFYPEDFWTKTAEKSLHAYDSEKRRTSLQEEIRWTINDSCKHSIGCYNVSYYVFSWYLPFDKASKQSNQPEA